MKCRKYNVDLKANVGRFENDDVNGKLIYAKGDDLLFVYTNGTDKYVAFAIAKEVRSKISDLSQLTSLYRKNALCALSK